VIGQGGLRLQATSIGTKSPMPITTVRNALWLPPGLGAA